MKQPLPVFHSRLARYRITGDRENTTRRESKKKKERKKKINKRKSFKNGFKNIVYSLTSELAASRVDLFHFSIRGKLPRVLNRTRIKIHGSVRAQPSVFRSLLRFTSRGY